MSDWETRTTFVGSNGTMTVPDDYKIPDDVKEKLSGGGSFLAVIPFNLEGAYQGGVDHVLRQARAFENAADIELNPSEKRRLQSIANGLKSAAKELMMWRHLGMTAKISRAAPC